MRIAIIGTAWPYRGGLAAYNERLAQEFMRQGHEVDIITFTLQYPDIFFPGKTQFADWPKPDGLSINRIVNSVWPLNWLSTGNLLAEKQYDLAVIKYWLPFMGPAFGTILRRIKANGHTKVVSVLDNIIPHEHRLGDRLFTRYFVKPVDAFVAQSKNVMEDLSQFDTQKPRALNPHPVFDSFGEPGPKEKARRNLNLPPGEKIILFFGFIRDYKGLDLLLHALATPKLQEMRIKLLVAGEFYSNEEKYLSLIRELSLEDRIYLHTKFIPDGAVANYFNAVDVVVQPYKDATQSGVTQIGYYFEKPMIVTGVGGLPEIIPHEKAGLVCEVNPGSIAGAIHRFYDEDMEEGLTEGAREEKKKFSWETMTQTIMGLYKKL